MEKLKKTLTTFLHSLTTVEDLEYFVEKLEKTSKINRRTVAGRELTDEIRGECNKKIRKIIKTEGIVPFD